MNGFKQIKVETSEAFINTYYGGKGEPLLLIHGFPQNHFAWHKTVKELGEKYFLVVPDLRGYGESRLKKRNPEISDFSKRSMASDFVELMDHFNFNRFFVAGHDRGGRVAYRMALDFPEKISKLAVLDVIPTYEMIKLVNLEFSQSTYHWFFLAQPYPLPENLIKNSSEFYLDYTLRSWSENYEAISDKAKVQYLQCLRQDAVLSAMCNDYRAGITFDVDHDKTDFENNNMITCPLMVLWGQKETDGVSFDNIEIWKKWAIDVQGESIKSGHFLMEEKPHEVVEKFVNFFHQTEEENTLPV